MADAVATTLARNRGGIPKGMMLDPTTGQLIPLGQQPTFSPTTNFGTGAPQGEHTDADGTFWDSNGTPWRLVGDQWIKGQKDPLTNQWRFANNNLQEVLAREGQLPGSAPAGSTGDWWRGAEGAALVNRANPVQPAAGGQSQLGSYQDLLNDTSATDAFRTGDAAWQQQLEAARRAASQGRTDQITRQQGFDQDAINRINDLVAQQAEATRAANAAQGQLTTDYQNQLAGFSSQLGGALGNFNTSMGALNTPFSARGYGADVVADPYGSGLQSSSYNTLSGIGGGSLDYQAQLASLAQAAAVRAQLSQWQTNPEDYARQLDALQLLQNDATYSYGEDGPTGLQQAALQRIQQDIANGGAQQQQTLDAILNEIQYGGGDQQDALSRLLTEAQQGGSEMYGAIQNIYGAMEGQGDRYRDISGRILAELEQGGAQSSDVIARLRADLDSGGADQRRALEKLWGLSDPQVTAQERYLSQLAQQSQEAQGRSSREAVDAELAARGLRGGSAAIGSALASQEQLGLQRTNTELGIQAAAQQRALQALGMYGNQADTYRAAQQAGLGLYGNQVNAGRSLQQQGLNLLNSANSDYGQLQNQGLGLWVDAAGTLRAQNQQALGMYANQTNAIRAAQQQGLAMANDAANKLRAAQQNGIALEASQANAIREAQQRGMAMYWNATAQLREQSDQVGMFNTGQANQNAMFNAENETNVNMFNAGQANSVNMFNAGQQNQASANNQQTRLSGSIAAGNMANQIRADNDAINMFNKEQSQITQRFQDQIAQNDLIRRQGVAEGQLTGNINAIGAQSGLAATGYQAGMSNINDPYARTTQSTGIGMNAAGNILGIQSQTNAIQGAAGQQDLNNLTGGYNTWISGQNTLNGLTDADRQRQQTAQALGTLATRGGYRMS